MRVDLPSSTEPAVAKRRRSILRKNYLTTEGTENTEKGWEFGAEKFGV
jgi:hypothetical protein